MASTAWDRPGGALLKEILPAWRAVTSEGAVDGFLGRQLGQVVVVIEDWIVRDARRSSQAAIPDARLENALRLAEGGDWEELWALARTTLSDYWAMNALRSRGADAHSDGANLVIDALVTARARWGGGDMQTMRAIKGTPPMRWRPPVYRRAPSKVSAGQAPEAPNDAELDARVLAAIEARAGMSAREIQATTGGKVVQVRRSLDRLIIQRSINWTARDGYAALHRGGPPGYVGFEVGSAASREEVDRRVVVALGTHTDGVTLAELWVDVPGSLVRLRASLARLIHREAATWKRIGGRVHYFPVLPALDWRARSHNGRRGFRARWEQGAFQMVETTPDYFALFFLDRGDAAREVGGEAVEAYGCGSSRAVRTLARQLAAAGMPYAAVWRHLGGQLGECPPAPRRAPG